MSPFVNIALFSVVTGLYFYWGKPVLTLQTLPLTHRWSHAPRFALYVLVLLLTQSMYNASVLQQIHPDASFGRNVGTAFVITLFPWLCLFGVMGMLLMLYPGLKSAFSDVLGYYWVASTASTLLTDLFVSTLDSSTHPTGRIDDKTGLMLDTVNKLMGNHALLINQWVPDNFLAFWERLKPLMKPNVAEQNRIQPLLFALVVSKDNVGECMWYVYTALVVISCVQLQFSNT